MREEAPNLQLVDQLFPPSASVDVGAEVAYGGPVWVSRDLAETDGVIVVNRVKPHTDFRGKVESGLVKMLVIGAGKRAGEALRPAGPLFPLPYDAKGDLRSPFAT